MVKDLGLVAQVFDEPTLATLEGGVAIGHTRYSTTGSSVWHNSQPSYRQVGDNGIALAHNGNLTNTPQLAADVGRLYASSDSDLMTEAIAVAMGGGADLATAVSATVTRFEGAFSLAIMDRDLAWWRCATRTASARCAWALCDPAGSSPPRPRPSTSSAPSSCARSSPARCWSSTVTAPGRGGHSPAPRAGCACSSSSTSPGRTRMLQGRNVHAARWQMGYRLAEQAPVQGDIVVPVPESGIPAAQGFAACSRIPYADGLVKNRYVGRTFIEPAQSMRDQGIRMKLNPIGEVLDGRRVVLVDDSIVRGSTTRQLIQMVRDAGASEIHLRISSPPYKWPCFYGMDTGDRDTLLAADRSVEEVREFLEVDSLGYLDLASVIEATGAGSFCTACLSGDYPTEVRAAG